jgi:probable HAF family extracellular repeat protein
VFFSIGRATFIFTGGSIMFHGRRIGWVFCILSTLIFLCGLPNIAWSQQTRKTYYIKDIGLLYNNEAQPHYFGGGLAGINILGDVVGYTTAAPPDYPNIHAFLYSKDEISGEYRMRDLGIGGYGIVSFAHSINDSRQIVGDCLDLYSGNESALLCEGGNITTLPNMKDTFAINNNGQILGYNRSPSYTGPVIYSQGSTIDIGSIGILNGKESHAWGMNQNGQISGWYADDNGYQQHPFIYSGGNVSTLQDQGNNEIILNGNLIVDVNNKGQVAGGYLVSENWQEYAHAFIYSNGTLTDIHANLNLQGSSYAVGINDKGQAIVNNDSVALLYSNGHMAPLGSVNSGLFFNNMGQVLTYHDNANCIYSAGQFLDLNACITWPGTWNLFENPEPHGNEGIVKTTLINDAGQIIGIAKSYEGYGQRAFIMTPGLWGSAGGGSLNWGDANNWAVADLPQYRGDIATFSDSYGNATINLGENRTLSGLVFNNSNGIYTITGNSDAKLIFDNNDYANSIFSESMIIMQHGVHSISAPVQLNSDLTIKTVLADNELTISGGITEHNNEINGPKTITITGEGKVTIDSIVGTGELIVLCSSLTVGSIVEGALTIGSGPFAPAQGDVILSVPEPSAWIPLIAGGLCLIYRRRRDFLSILHRAE